MVLRLLCRLEKMRAHTLTLIAGLLLVSGGISSAQESAPPSPPQTDAEKAALLDRVISNQKKNDEAMNLHERIERRELRKNSGDPQPLEVRISRVVPAGTGIDHIAVGPDGKPADLSAYHAELEKLERALAWAAEDGRAQRDAYEKIAKKQKDRNELIDATRTAFLYTFLSTEPRGDSILAKYRMEPNPAYKPTSRATSIFSKVRGFVWIDLAAGELARVEGEVTGDISIGLVLGKIYKGSHFMQERYEMAPGLWMPSFSQYDFDGRKLFVSFSIHERTFYTQFRRIGPPKEALGVIRAELGKPGPNAADP